MKKITKYIACLAVGALVAGTMSSCADDLREDFNDPDQMTEPQFNLFFSSALTQGHLFRMEYGPTYHYMIGFSRMLGLCSRPDFLDASQNNSISQPWLGWSGVEFNRVIFNKTAVDYSKNLNAMDLMFADMSEEDRQRNMEYIYCRNIISAYAYQRCTDLYDDIPYFGAGGAFHGQFYVEYDTQEEIYDDIMTKLKDAVEGLSAFEFQTDMDKSQFEASDILCKGDLDQWIRFANSLRLRMAMRLCHVKPDVAQATIRELINDNRMITEYEYNIGFEEQDKTHAFELTFYRGIEERANECIAPETMIQGTMNYKYQPGDENGIAEDRHDFDPRLYAMFQPDRHGRYIGLPMHMADTVKLHEYYTDQEIYDMFQYDDYSDSPWSPTRLVTMYNRRTYFNFDMAFPVVHAPEVHLLLAEAAVRWPGSFSDINAAEHIKQAIDISTRFYYDSNINNKYNAATIPSLQYLKASAEAPRLDEAHLADYCEFVANKFNALSSTQEKYKFIFDQKFLDMNIMNPYEIYNEARRLVKDLNGELPIIPLANIVFMDRFYYPDSEGQENSENFQEVAHKNNHTTPVWWADRTTTAVNTNGDAL